MLVGQNGLLVPRPEQLQAPSTALLWQILEIDDVSEQRQHHLVELSPIDLGRNPLVQSTRDAPSEAPPYPAELRARRC
jgi:hypothetical protein